MRTASRRQFLQRGIAAVVGPLVAPHIIPNGVLAADGKPGANERITIGVIGVGNRARLLIRQVPEPGRIVALADCNLTRCHEATKAHHADWACHQDYRIILDRKDIDGVIVATTDHARVLACILACQAGKDIYAEKPLSLTVREGRALVDAVRMHRRVLQVGSQQRSMEMNRCACDFIRSGQLGKIGRVQAIYWDGPGDCTNGAGEPVPEGLDWNLWLNQARFRPYRGEIYTNWRWLRDYGGGEMTNMGPHGLDQVQSALGMDETGPVEFCPIIAGHNDVPFFRYANGIRVDLNLRYGHGPEYGAIFTGTNGKIEITRNKFTTNPKDLIKIRPSDADVAKWRDETGLYQAKYHIANWLDCIKTRQKPTADVEIGHRSTSVCHLNNIARELGRRIQWDPEKEQILGDEEANRLLSRPRRQGYELPHLA